MRAAWPAWHDVVMVGYRGVDGSSVLNCPEVTAALESSADFLGKASLSAYSRAFASCARRLERSGVDLAGYTLAEQAADIEAARVALGYQRIDLVSESEGTRLAMIYAWRYPGSVGRSVMVGVNPPGNFIYSGTEIDQGIGRYSALCAQQPACRARTGNLAASMRHTAAHMPSRWYFLPIKPGNALVGTFFGLTDTTAAVSPLSGPMTLDSWISAAHGDPSGLWFLSTLAGLVFPQSFTWGEFASIGVADAHPAERYFGSGADRGSIIGNPFTDFLWGAGGMAHAWPANPGENQYTSVQNSSVPTLLVGGPLDFETPAQNATKELLPHLSNGHQVILSGLGHAEDFWYYEPKASTRLLTTFFATGRVDTSGYTPNKVSFATSPTQTAQTAIARDLLAAMIGFALLAALWLLWVARRVRKHGAAGRMTSVATRTILTVVLGLGGWFAAALVVLTLWPALSLGSELLGILAISVPIALGLYLAWTHRDWDRATKSLGLLAATAGAVAGGWFGFTATSGLFAIVTTTIGAAAAGNLTLIAVSLYRERSARGHGNHPAPQPTPHRPLRAAITGPPGSS